MSERKVHRGNLFDSRKTSCYNEQCNRLSHLIAKFSYYGNILGTKFLQLASKFLNHFSESLINYVLLYFVVLLLFHCQEIT